MKFSLFSALTLLASPAIAVKLDIKEAPALANIESNCPDCYDELNEEGLAQVDTEVDAEVAMMLEGL